MICTLTIKDEIENWCERHKMQHRGHYAAYAVDPGEKGKRFREYWDELAGLAPPTDRGVKPAPDGRRMLRSLPIAKTCVRNTGKNGQAKAGCGECTTYACSLKGTVKLSECVYCTDYLANPKPDTEYSRHGQSIRHLLFHLWPKKTSQGTWQRNLDQLKQRWSLFDGKRVIAVATSPDSHSLESVQEYMQGYDCDYVHVENDPTLREVKTFLPLFEPLEGLPGYIFYAQGKGVTKPVNPGVSIHAWTSAMYEILLDYWPLAEEKMKHSPVVGAFKKTVDGAFGGSRSTWHYSGSFCWFRNDELWKRPWRDIEQVWFGIESYPSMIFSREESACLFHCWHKQFNLYNLQFWQQVEQELEQWRKDHAAYRRIP